MRKNFIENIYPLSPVQQGILFHTLLSPGSGLYLQQRQCTLRGELNAAAFKEAWRRVFERHAALRTAFNWEQREEPFQFVLRQVELPWEEHDWRGLDAREQERRLDALLGAEREQGLDLSRPPLSRLRLIRTGDDVHRFVWSLHHLLLDGWSLALVLKEVFALHEAACRGQQPALAPTRPFADYVAWLRRQDASGAERFWRETLAGVSAPTPLGVARHAPGSPEAESSQGFDARELRLSEEATRALQSFARGHQLTLNTLLQGAWALLLARYSGERDVVFGTTVSGRSPALAGVENMVGMLINTLPVRVGVPGGATVLEWLRSIQARHLEMQRYDFSPLLEIQRLSEVAPNLPLFHSLFVLKNYIQEGDAAAGAAGGSGISVEETATEDRANYPLTFSATPGRELSLIIDYDTSLFDLETARRMLRHLRQLLHEFAADASRPLALISPLTDGERAQLLAEWNDTRADFPEEACLHELFEQQAARTPGGVAVVCADGSELTFDELNRRANRLAHHLRRLGVGADTLVGLCVERSAEMLTGLLAVLKAGGAYVPLDPNYPRERLAFMLAETAAPVLLTRQRLAADLPACGARVLCLDSDWARVEAEPDANPPRGCVADNLAYAIFTSGSTGKPKAALVAHRALVNYATEMVRQFGLRPADRVLQFASPAFDVLAEEVFPTWLAGAAVVLPEEELLFSCDELTRVIAERGVTGCELPAAYWQEWVRRLAAAGSRPPASLRFVLVGCERPTPDSLALWDAFGLPLIYVYGITETTITSTLFRRAPEADGGPNVFELPIGKPVANTRVYVLDEGMRPVPVGVRGELYIAGEGLARGYLNRPDLTAERFVPDPFSQAPGARLYKTGDVARYLADGNVEFLGRSDRQVKVRGYRIELGEVEAALAEHAGVREALVTVRGESADEQQLVAYVIPDAPGATAGDAAGPVGGVAGEPGVGFLPSHGEYPVYDELLYYAMDSDARRNDFYRRAVSRFARGKTVVDVGTGGDAVLTRLCVEGGAAKVYAIERMDESYRLAQATIKRAGLQDTVQLIHGDAVGVELPEPVDVCISELIGTIGGSEGAAATLNKVRRFLKPGGVMIPSRCVTKIAAVTLPDEAAARPRFTEVGAHYAQRVFEALGKPFDLRVCVKNLPPSHLLSNEEVFEDLDFNRPTPTAISRAVRLEMERGGRLDGFLLWINLYVVDEEALDSLREECSWLPLYCPAFGGGVEVSAGDVLEGVCESRPSDNGVNPDYRIKGVLRRQGGGAVEFEWVSPHHEGGYKQSAFYEALFAEESARPPALPTRRDLRAYLQGRLPEYMIPSAFVTLDEWPLTSNGKVDWRALPAPDQARPETSETYAAPRNAVEETVARIWGEVLGLERVGVFDNFFDLGGHSLLAVRVITRVREAFEVELPLRSILDAPSVASLSVVVVQQQAAGEDAEELARILAELEAEGEPASLSH